MRFKFKNDDFNIPCIVFTIYGIVVGSLSFISLKFIDQSLQQPYFQIQSNWNQSPIHNILIQEEKCPNSFQPITKNDDFIWLFEGKQYRICQQSLYKNSFQYMAFNQLCSVDEKICGNNDYNYQICVPKNQICPIFDMQLIVNNSLYLNQEKHEEIIQINGNYTNYYIHLFRQAQYQQNDQSPLIEFTIQQHFPCINDQYDKCERDDTYSETGFYIDSNVYEQLNNISSNNSNQQYQIYERGYVQFEKRCRDNKMCDQFIKSNNWMLSIVEYHLVSIVFSFTMSFLLICFALVPKKEMGCCCLNLIVNISFPQASGTSAIFSYVQIKKLQEFTEFIQINKCGKQNLIEAFKMLTQSYSDVIIYDIIILVIYTICTSYLIVFHLLRLYKNRIGDIQSNIDEEQINKWKIYPIKAQEFANCAICLNNQPIPHFTQCCGQPLHKQCNTIQIKSCPYCRLKGRPQIIYQIKFEERAYIKNNEERVEKGGLTLKSFERQNQNKCVVEQVQEQQ